MADPTDSFPDLRSVYKSSGHQINRLSQNVANMKLASAQDGDKENSLGSNNKGAENVGFPQDSTPNVWGHPNVIQKLRMQGNHGPEKVTHKAWSTQNAVSWTQQGDRTWGNSSIKSPSSEYGRNDPDQAGFTFSNDSRDGQIKTDHEVGDKLDDEIGDNENVDDEYGNGVSNIEYDSDDIDDYVSDSDEDEKSHEARKESKWFYLFFKSLEKLTVEEILSPVRRWHCPACQGGPGAINWYRGVQSLLTHSMTKTTRRAKLHRVFAGLLVEEMCRRGAFIKPVNDAFGRWEGLTDRVADHEIVWPPMVTIMNTRYEQDENGKWTGMGNQELLNYFSSYAAVKARHSYGPQGHRGMSLLIFESSAAGYLEAARLHKHFKEQGRDRDAWDCSRVPFCPGGKRQLYGYIAMKEDLDLFNQHSQGKSKLKFETRSYQEMVESQIKKINDDSQQLNLLKKKVAQEQQHSQVLAESLGRLSEKLRQTTEEYAIIRQQSRLQHEQNKEELGAKEQYFKEKINVIYQAIKSKEDNFEKLQRAARERVERSNATPINNEDQHSAIELEENSRSITIQEKKMEEFEAEREKLMKSHQDRRLAITQRYWEELIELEEGFEKELTLLMGKYNPDRLEEETTDSDETREKQEIMKQNRQQ
ncbi:protein SUPPRESSOR OF GENE SILENCING 3-like [Gossypium arboreum]|uniref:protein SUPPRESSOR OF GENE SILENCING 3-like n=1 Tax=Gossypium arboreum TaxID=29729 RepID=UPI000818F4D8|nr:protein SUPPRESSOR OF GENE SILENCING 3-like [Gossypium arboreum]